MPTRRAAPSETAEPPATVAAPATFDELGRVVRSLRKRRGLTLVQVAELTAYSHSFISQVERGVTKPSMESLHRIAHALGSTAQDLLSTGVDGPVSVVRAHEGTAEVSDGGRVRALVRGTRELQPLEFVGVSQAWGAYYAHAGAEFLHVVDGVAEVDIEGRDPFVIGPGDTVYWAGGIRHRWRQVGDTPVRALLVLDTVGDESTHAAFTDT